MHLTLFTLPHVFSIFLSRYTSSCPVHLILSFVVFILPASLISPPSSPFSITLFVHPPAEGTGGSACMPLSLLLRWHVMVALLCSLPLPFY